ncbi:MAG: hypothetical protein CMJ18_27960 [Phycisphaeraceae bacterium]|nr:hypothetical protein [Phycisphaeraceae bacterium]
MPSNDSTSTTWLIFALMTVACWGLYGVLLHSGQVAMGDAANGRYKAFLWVGIAYFLSAVLAPLAMLWWRGASWQMSGAGITLSLLAGLVGAIGAFCVLLAFGAKGAPSVVMSIVFAGAPVINALVAVTLAGSWSRLRWQFVAGIVLAAIGGCLVTLYRPPPVHAPPPAAAEAPEAR